MKKKNLFYFIMGMLAMFCFISSSMASEKVQSATQEVQDEQVLIPEVNNQQQQIKLSPMVSTILSATQTIENIPLTLSHNELNINDINTLIWVKVQQEQTIKFLKSKYIALEERYSNIINILNQLSDIKDINVITNNLDQIVNVFLNERLSTNQTNQSQSNQ